MDNNIKELQPIHINQNSFYGKALVQNLEDGRVRLLSYGTPIADVQGGQIVMLTDNEAHYSNTTIRHLNEFLVQQGIEKMTKSNYIEKAHAMSVVQ